MDASASYDGHLVSMIYHVVTDNMDKLDRNQHRSHRVLHYRTQAIYDVSPPSKFRPGRTSSDLSMYFRTRNLKMPQHTQLRVHTSRSRFITSLQSEAHFQPHTRCRICSLCQSLRLHKCTIGMCCRHYFRFLVNGPTSNSNQQVYHHSADGKASSSLTSTLYCRVRP